MRVLGLPPVRVCHHLDWFCWKKRRQLRQLIFYIRAATFSQKMYTLGLARNMDNISRLVNQSEENCKQRIKCWPVFRYERSKRGIYYTTSFPSSILICLNFMLPITHPRPLPRVRYFYEFGVYILVLESNSLVIRETVPAGWSTADMTCLIESSLDTRPVHYLSEYIRTTCTFGVT